MDKLKAREVFVPGGQPRHTYVRRDNLRLEAQLRSASDNLCKIVTVTGPTKSGKSVLAHNVYPKGQALWVNGGSVGGEDELWSQIVDELGGYTQTGRAESHGADTEIGGEVSSQLKFPFLAGLAAKVSGKRTERRGATLTQTRTAPAKARAIGLLQRNQRPLVIDDFHYLARDIQGTLVRGLKALVFDGHPVILLAIPHRRYDAVRVEKEMTGRIEQIQIPSWDVEHLTRIAELGFPLLNAQVDEEVVKRLANESLGSPHLMQEFCLELCKENGLEVTLAAKTRIGPKDAIEQLFTRVAEHTSKTVFERLAKGPRQRRDRKQRQFKDGSRADIYVAVVKALAQLRPGIATLDYEQIRSALRDLLVELPQANEVSSVLEHMSKIQADEAASVPVLDWDKDERRLHIIDPYFAFFLRWAPASGTSPGDTR